MARCTVIAPREYREVVVAHLTRKKCLGESMKLHGWGTYDSTLVLSPVRVATAVSDASPTWKYRGKPSASCCPYM